MWRKDEQHPAHTPKAHTVPQTEPLRRPRPPLQPPRPASPQRPRAASAGSPLEPPRTRPRRSRSSDAASGRATRVRRPGSRFRSARRCRRERSNLRTRQLDRLRAASNQHPGAAQRSLPAPEGLLQDPGPLPLQRRAEDRRSRAAREAQESSSRDAIRSGVRCTLRPLRSAPRRRSVRARSAGSKGARLEDRPPLPPSRQSAQPGVTGVHGLARLG